MIQIEQEKKALTTNEALITIDAPYPYIAIGDLPEVVLRLGISSDNELPPIEQLQEELYSILQIASPPKTSFFSIPFSSLKQQISQRLTKTLSQDPNTAIVLMDRYLSSPSKNSNVFRLEVSRKTEGGLTSRPGTNTSPENQIQNLISWMLKIQPHKLVLVDDVLAFADTSIPLIQLFQKQLPFTDIKFLVGIASSQGIWSGIEKVKKETGVDTEAIILAKASPKTNWSSGMAIPTSRDFTIFGGKISTTDNLTTPLSIPYFLPFTIPQSSFMLDQDIFTISEALLKYNLKLVNVIETNLNKTITIRDLVQAGFGIPFSNLKCFSNIAFPNPNTSVSEYILYYQNLLETNTQPILKEVISSRQ